MCNLCDRGFPRLHARRGFLKASAAAGATTAAAGAMALFAPRPALAHGDDREPSHSGHAGRRYLIRGGAVMSMDATVGDFAEADVLVEGKKIVAVGPNLNAWGAGVIDARGRIVMPGFVDTHHHLFETALRSFLADGLLFDGLDPAITQNYFQKILLTFAPQYRPEDVYISTLFGALSQLDAGVTTVHDISQIHHSPTHSDVQVKALRDAQMRAVFGYFESAGGVAGNQYPNDARRLKLRHFSSTDQLLTMFMGGEIYLPGYEAAWRLGRELGLPVAAHIVGTFGMRPAFDLLAQGLGGDSGTLGIGADNFFVHMTGMSDMAWQRVRDTGAGVSLAVPIEMNMAHGTPPVLKAQSLGIRPSLSSDVECTLTADFFTQMRTTMALQRMFVNAVTLAEPNMPPLPPTGLPRLTARDVIGYATINGARDLRLEAKIGSLKPGKEADIVILDAEAINVAPLNHVPGAVVSLMERSNVETVIVAGKVRKWKGRLLDVNLARLRRELEASRDRLFAAAGIPRDLFRPS
ncbi:MAG: amidohydrolase family protein [Betaproteobacteria bacterium]|nr:amidohydrolase family protein [Betaproteobacteria bacterium]